MAKLVRSKVPELVKNDPRYKLIPVKPEDKIYHLGNKLEEEVAELLAAVALERDDPTDLNLKNNTLFELADVLEVLEAICADINIDDGRSELEYAILSKREAKGDFISATMLLEQVTPKMYGQWQDKVIK